MTDIFQPIQEQTQLPENPLEVLVGEGKKFKSVEDLAKGKIKSDNFIKQLQNELAELRDQVGKHQTMEEIKTQILSSLKQEKPLEQPVQPPTHEPNDSDKVDVESLVATLLEKREIETRQKTNKQVVQDALEKKFGADAQLILNQKAKELSVSLDYLAKVAHESPSAFFRLVGIDQATPAHQPAPAPRSSQSAPVTPQSGVRNKSYYEKLKTVNPSEYFSQKTQMQMYKDAMAQGESFYS